MIQNPTQQKRSNNAIFFTFINSETLMVNYDKRDNPDKSNLILFKYRNENNKDFWDCTREYKMKAYKHIDYANGLLAIAYDYIIYIYKFERNELHYMCENNLKGYVKKMKWSPDGCYLAICKGGFDFIDFYFVNNGRLVEKGSYTSADRSAFSNFVWYDKNTILVNSYDGKMSFVSIDNFTIHNNRERATVSKSFTFTKVPDNLCVTHNKCIVVTVGGVVYVIDMDNKIVKMNYERFMT